MKFILFVFLILTSSSAFSKEALYEDQFGKVNTLSEEQYVPFKFQNKTIFNEHVSKKYKASVHKFPTVQSCLDKEEQSKSKPDLHRFNWTAFRNSKDADVCLFRIATSYSDIEGFIKWLKHYKFDVSTIDKKDPWPKTNIVNAGRSHRDRKPLFKLGLDKLFRFSYSYTIQLHLDENGKILTLTSHFNSL